MIANVAQFKSMLTKRAHQSVMMRKRMCRVAPPSCRRRHAASVMRRAQKAMRSGARMSTFLKLFSCGESGNCMAPEARARIGMLSDDGDESVDDSLQSSTSRH